MTPKLQRRRIKALGLTAFVAIGYFSAQRVSCIDSSARSMETSDLASRVAEDQSTGRNENRVGSLSASACTDSLNSGPVPSPNSSVILIASM